MAPALFDPFHTRLIAHLVVATANLGIAPAPAKAEGNVLAFPFALPTGAGLETGGVAFGAA